jgi:hypothetical protein
MRTTPASDSLAELHIDLPDDSPETLLREFAARGWGDGLPLIPPTPDRVDAMLEHADGDPDEVLATLPPRGGQLTRRVVAVNAVLAGCDPVVFPVVLTAAIALGHPRLNLAGMNPSTHPAAPLVIVHGESVRTGGFNAGPGAFGPGNRANATVGRAVRLVLLHVAGAIPGAGDQSSQGQPAKYAYCVAENAEATPWKGYAESVGVATPSAVTVLFGEGPHNMHDAESRDDPGRLLDKVASGMRSLANNHGPVHDAEVFLVWCPEHAAIFRDAEWDRPDIARYLHQRVRLPAGLLRRHFEQRMWPGWMDAFDDDVDVPMLSTPDNVRSIVVGGPGRHSSFIPSWGATKSVTLPVNG